MRATLTLMCFPANPSSSVKTGLTLGLHGWNVSENAVKVGGEK